MTCKLKTVENTVFGKELSGFYENFMQIYTDFMRIASYKQVKRSDKQLKKT